MASHSEHEYFVRGYQASAIAASRFVDTGAARDALVNNARHLHDGSGQVVANLSREAGAYWQQEVVSTTAYLRVNDLPAIEFPLRIAETGNSFLVVPYLRAHLSGAGTGNFRVQLWFASAHLFAPHLVGATCAQVSTTSTTATGAVLEPDPIYIPAGSIATNPDLAFDERPGLRADGSLGSARYLRAAITIWAQVSIDSIQPRINGFAARQYVGP